MQAIYKAKLYVIGDDLNRASLIDPETGTELSVSYGDPELIVDPTDTQINNVLNRKPVESTADFKHRLARAARALAGRPVEIVGAAHTNNPALVRHDSPPQPDSKS